MIRTFVLVHGAFCNAAAWGPTIRELALRGHRALAVDLPGHGPTDVRSLEPSHVRFQIHPRELVELLDELAGTSAAR